MKVIRLSTLSYLILFVFSCHENNIFNLEKVNTENYMDTISTYYKHIKINNIKVFYREAGDKENPAILFLHGFPSSSHMYRDIMDDLANKYYVIAPDYPGFGQSDFPPPSSYEYSFENLSRTIEKFIDTLQIKNIHLFMQDYGGPVGFRIAVRRPELFKTLVLQNANTYEEGFGEITQDFQNYFRNPTEGNQEKIMGFFSLEGTKMQYLDGVKDSVKISPDSYSIDQYYLYRENNTEIQLALFRDYITNVRSYPVWQEYLRKYNPSTLVVWGKNDKIFTVAGAKAYLKDIPEAELHLFDGGHFMLEEYHGEVAKLMDTFIQRNIDR